MANFEVAVILPVIFVIGYYGYLISIIKQEMFEVHGFLKSFFLIFNFWLLLFPMSLAIDFVGFNSGTIAMKDTLSAMYLGMVYINWFMTIYFLVFLFISTMRSVKENAK